MNVLVISGEKTQNIVNSIGKCFSAGSVDFLVERDISGIERFFDAGRYFDRAIIIDYGISYGLEVGDAQAIRNRMNNFIQTVLRRSRNQPKMVFVCGTEAMADIVYQETMAVAAHSKVLMLPPPYNVSFMVSVVAKHLEELSQWGYEEYLAKKAEEEEKNRDTTLEEDTGIEIDGITQLLQGGADTRSRRRGAGAFTVTQRDLQEDDPEQSGIGGLPGLGGAGDGLPGLGQSSGGWDELPSQFQDTMPDEGQASGGADGAGLDDDEDQEEDDIGVEIPMETPFVSNPVVATDDVPEEGSDNPANWPRQGGLDFDTGDSGDSWMPTPQALPGFPPAYPNNHSTGDDDDTGDDADSGIELDLPAAPVRPVADQEPEDEQEGDWERAFEARRADLAGAGDGGGLDSLFEGSGETEQKPEGTDELPGFPVPGQENTAEHPDTRRLEPDETEEPEYGPPPGIDLFDESTPSTDGATPEMPEGFSQDMYEAGRQQQEAVSQQPAAPIPQPAAQAPKGKLFGRGKKTRQSAPQPQPQFQRQRPVQSGSVAQMSQSNFEDLKTVLKTFKLRGHIISVTGVPSSGKTTLVANLADIANSLDCSVLMVDFDVNGRDLAYQSKMAYDAVHSIEVSRSFIREAVNGEKAIASRASIISPGQHLLTTGLASDLLGEDWTSPERLSRFCSMAKAQYQVILFDIPWDFAVGTGSKLLFNSDELVITSGLNTHDLMNLMIRICNVGDESLAEIMWTQSKLMFTKVRKVEQVLGRRVSGIRDILRGLDSQVEALLGEPAEFQFENMCVAGQIPYDPGYESYWMAKERYTSDAGHYQLYTEALRKVLIAD